MTRRQEIQFIDELDLLASREKSKWRAKASTNTQSVHSMRYDESALYHSTLLVVRDLDMVDMGWNPDPRSVEQCCRAN